MSDRTGSEDEELESMIGQFEADHEERLNGIYRSLKEESTGAWNNKLLLLSSRGQIERENVYTMDDQAPDTDALADQAQDERVNVYTIADQAADALDDQAQDANEQVDEIRQRLTSNYEAAELTEGYTRRDVIYGSITAAGTTALLALGFEILEEDEEDINTDVDENLQNPGAFSEPEPGYQGGDE